ncbi:MAG: glutamate racemase [Butyricicoccaceae bacterium]
MNKTDVTAPVAVFDSGVGGISVLKELAALLPHENFWFFGDSAHVPYGTKTIEEIQTLTCRGIDHMIDSGAKAVVIACNTATSAAAEILRRKHPELPIIGIEPALKPAALSHEHSRVLVMATPLTLKLAKFNNLMHHYEDRADTFLLPCPGLVELIERGALDTPEMHVFLRDLLADYIAHPVDSVVLGCTHYPFAKKALRDVLGDHVQFFDGGAGTARQLKRQLEAWNLLNPSGGPGKIIFDSSKPSKEEYALCEYLFQLEI